MVLPAPPGLGAPFLDRVREVGPRIVCAHKGLAGPIPSLAPATPSPRDIGPAAPTVKQEILGGNASALYGIEPRSRSEDERGWLADARRHLASRPL